MPVLGNEASQIQGRVRAFDLPSVAHRKAFNEDLMQKRKAIQVQLRSMAHEMAENPGQHSDILGALQVARQQLNLPEFRNHRHAAEQLARRLAGGAGNQTSGAAPLPVFMGLLASRDAAGLEEVRREAIMDFWKTYLPLRGMKPEIYTDGPDAISAVMQ